MNNHRRKITTRGVINANRINRQPIGSLRLGEGDLVLQNAEGPGWRSIPLDEDTNQHHELIAWLEGGPESRQSARIARATTEIMMAVYESARSRGLVTLPLLSARSPLHLMIDEGSLPVQVLGKYDIRA